MKTDSLASKLLKGTRNIDRMREDLNSIIPLVVGFIRKNVHGTERVKKLKYHVELESGEYCTWDVQIRSNLGMEWVPNVESVEIAFWYRDANADCMSDLGKGLKFLRPCEIQRAYEAVDALVLGIAKEFPDLERRWQFVLDASKLDL